MAKKSKGEQAQLSRRRITCGLGALALGSVVPSLPLVAFAQAPAYPSRPVRILVGYSAGGTTDVMARLIAESLREVLGQNVVVENQPGASGNIAAQTVARAPADGHTLLLGATGEMSINKHVKPDSGFDPETDLAPIALVYSITHAITVSSKSPYKTLSDLLEAAKREPGKVKFASAGLGTPGHLAGETLVLKTKTQMTHVPYKGGSQALTDVIGGHVDCYFSGLTAAVPHLKNGTIRLLAITGPRRVSIAPDVPTVTEATGVQGYDFPLWGALFAPAKTPKEIVALLNREVNKAFERPEVQAKVAAQHSEIIKYSPEELAAFLKADSEKYREITKGIGLGR